jgi:hypothetical protein
LRVSAPEILTTLGLTVQPTSMSADKMNGRDFTVKLQSLEIERGVSRDLRYV